MRRGLAFAALVVLGGAVTGCAAGSGATTPSSSVAPTGIPDCSEVYADGADIVSGDFGAACIDTSGRMLTPLPITVQCGDDRTLVWNDLAWGYVSETMTLTSEDDADKVPPERLSDCLAGDGGPSTGAPSTTLEEG